MKLYLLALIVVMVIGTASAASLDDFEAGDLSKWFFSGPVGYGIAELEPGNNLLRIYNSIDVGDGLSWYMAFYMEGNGIVLNAPVSFSMYELPENPSDDAYITCAVLYGDGSMESTEAEPRQWETNEWVKISCNNIQNKPVKGVEVSFWRSATGTFYFDDFGLYEEPGITGAAVAVTGSAPVLAIAMVVGVISIYLLRR